MKCFRWLFTALSLAILAVRGADSTAISSLSRADDARVAATLAADGTKLSQFLSDDLRYTHSSGASDTKSSLTESLVTGHLKYLSFHYEERKFTLVTPDVALMSGRVRAATSRGGPPKNLYLTYLAVWRDENGSWRMVGWQSGSLPPPVAR